MKIFYKNLKDPLNVIIDDLLHIRNLRIGIFEQTEQRIYVYASAERSDPELPHKL